MTSINSLKDLKNVLIQDRTCNITRAAKACKESELAREVFNNSLDLENLDWWSEREGILFSLMGSMGKTEAQITEIGRRIWTFEQNALADEEELMAVKLEELVVQNKVLSLKYFLEQNSGYFKDGAGEYLLKDAVVRLNWEDATRSQLETLVVILQTVSEGIRTLTLESILKKDEKLHSGKFLKNVLYHGNEYLLLRIADGAKRELFSVTHLCENMGEVEGILVLLRRYPVEFGQMISDEVDKDLVTFFILKVANLLMKVDSIEGLELLFNTLGETTLASIYQRSSSGVNILCKAAGRGNIQVIDFVIDHAPPTVQVSQFFPIYGSLTPVVFSLENEDANSAKRILERCPVEAARGLVTVGTLIASTPLQDIISSWNDLKGNKEGLLEILFRRCPFDAYEEFFKNFSSKRTPFETVLKQKKYDLAILLVRCCPGEALHILLREGESVNFCWTDLLTEDNINDAFVDFYPQQIDLIRNTIISEIERVKRFNNLTSQ